MGEDFKTHLLMVFIFIVILGLSVSVTGFCAYKIGKATGRAEGINESILKHPPTIQTGSNPVINNNVHEIDNHFRIGVWPLRFGWCG